MRPKGGRFLQMLRHNMKKLVSVSELSLLAAYTLFHENESVLFNVMHPGGGPGFESRLLTPRAMSWPITSVLLLLLLPLRDRAVESRTPPFQLPCPLTGSAPPPSLYSPLGTGNPCGKCFINDSVTIFWAWVRLGKDRRFTK